MNNNGVSIEEWRKNPVRAAEKYRALKAAGKFEPGLTQRILGSLSFGKSWTGEQMEALDVFTEFLSEGRYHSANLMAENVLEGGPADFQKVIEPVALEKLQEYQSTRDSRYLEDTFSLLDSFNYRGDVRELRGFLRYLDKTGPDRLIDRVASDIREELEGTSRVMFEKYVEENSAAFLYDEKGDALEEDHYIKTASEIYQDLLEEDPLEALKVAERFELDEEKIENARERYRREEVIDKAREGEVGDLDEEEIEWLLEEDMAVDEGGRYDKNIGNFLTDIYLWRRNPEEAVKAGDEPLKNRIELVRQGRRKGKPSENSVNEIFEELMSRGEYHAASAYAETAGIDFEDRLDQEVLDLLRDEDYKETFAALDSFNYEKNTPEIAQKRVRMYFLRGGPSKLVDKVASDVWRELEGSARAFFQMYIDELEQRPEESFDTETVAATYIPGSDTRRKADYYRHDAFFAYEQALREGRDKEADEIVERFDLDI